MFRSHASQLRSPQLPTSYPLGLQPVASEDLNSSGAKQLHRRVSRTDLDFEQALRAGGTVVLKEGLDVNALGVDASPNNSFSFSSPSPSRHITPRAQQPSTPIVVPPTPSPVAGPSSARTPASSQSSSSHDIFYDAEESLERKTNRRSLYRSPGTSSSPDLATLLRKAKEKGGVLPAHYKREKRRESPPPLPNALDRQSSRQRSSTTSHSSNSSSPQVTPLKGKLKANDASPDWVLTSPRPSKENGSKPFKSSMRAKTSAFLGKMLGQGTGTVRERSKTDASMSSAPSTPTFASSQDSYPPPVPPIPAEHQKTPVGSPIADVFTSPRQNHLDLKPLPQVMGNNLTKRSMDDSEDHSLVFVDAGLPVEDVGTIKPSSARKKTPNFEDETPTPTISTLPASPPSQTTQQNGEALSHSEDASLNGILDDFKGELSHFDEPVSGSLDLRDPSTPARRAAYRSRTDTTSSSHHANIERPSAKKSASAPTPSLTPNLTLQIPEHRFDIPNAKEHVPSPIVPPRTSSLVTRDGTIRASSYGSPRASKPHRSGALLDQQTAGLRVFHRSTASSSEPSLIPNGGDKHALPANRRNSQNDLTVNDLTLSRYASYTSMTHSSAGTGDESTGDLDARGKELATRCWSEDEEFLAKEKIAEWLGGHGRINKAALSHYVNYFDFSGLRLDLAFRRLCAKLYLKGETQQVDRILEEFSRRYWECNPGGLYGSANIVHAVTYSLLLLNTDLHVADLSTRMSRSQFVQNTLAAIRTQLHPSLPIEYSTPDYANDDGHSSVRGDSDGVETISRSKRSDSITSWNSISREGVLTAAAASQVVKEANGSTPSVQASMAAHSQRSGSNPVYGREWEGDMESLLKEMYNAIKSQQILQPLSSSGARPSLSSLSPGPHVLRSRSIRGQQDRLTTLKRGSIRGLQSIVASQTGASPYSSNSSIDGRVSPSPSFATSTHEAFYGSTPFLAPTLGFASNLSHTIIREAQEDDNRSIQSRDSDSTTISISDEELALLGAPWAKEGMLCRKQYWESTGKRARDKAWLDVFVVIQKGELNMFTFGDRSSSNDQAVGGGNWLTNAHPVGTIHLAHSLAHPLPPPGYSRQRPYCMVLTLSNGGVYFFQAGTEELVNEWVSTCNYWAARTSKEPLAGGVSNMEYGWNRVADPYPHARSQSDSESIRDPTDYVDALSIRSGKSTRSTRSRFGWKEGAATVRAPHSPWSDKVIINDWKPPMPPTVASVHDEETQLEALRKHVAYMKKDLERHNDYREPMTALYQPRSANAMKAQSNWEKKSRYLLTEIVKYESYIESLLDAMSLRLKKRGEKALERALNGTAPEEAVTGKGKWRGPEETIKEEIEPGTAGINTRFKLRNGGTSTEDGH